MQSYAELPLTFEKNVSFDIQGLLREMCPFLTLPFRGERTVPLTVVQTCVVVL